MSPELIYLRKTSNCEHEHTYVDSSCWSKNKWQNLFLHIHIHFRNAPLYSIIWLGYLLHLRCTDFSKNKIYCLHPVGFKKCFSNRVRLYCWAISNAFVYEASIKAAPCCWNDPLAPSPCFLRHRSCCLKKLKSFFACPECFVSRWRLSFDNLIYSTLRTAW